MNLLNIAFKVSSSIYDSCADAYKMDAQKEKCFYLQ